MRVGQNPAKAIQHVNQPQAITVAVITYIPFLSGYYTQSLDVLRFCLESLITNSDLPFDLMVFDNGSCPEVVTYLTEMQQVGKIQYLVLSDQNIGKVGAWNFIFSAAPGEYIAYADSDIFFYPGWLSKHIKIFETFPEAGTVCGLPRRGRRVFYTNTIQQGPDLPGVIYEEGQFIQ
jgi:glycosyltransferase involved in cell wall biosynthesis